MAVDQSRYWKISSRDLAFCGLFGAAALLLPSLFHLIQLGRIFMPMYLPLMFLPFFVRPLPAALTALLTPLFSALLTGMPPLFPPVALAMSLELALMAGLLSIVARRFPAANEWLLLVPVLILGRAVSVGLSWLFALAMELPAAFLASVSFVSGWPGILLMCAVIPPLVRPRRRMALQLHQEIR